MPKTYLKNSLAVALLLCVISAFVLLPTTLKRGLFFREDYLPYLTKVAAAFAVVSVIAVLRGDRIWNGDVDILLALTVALYFLTNIWAVSKMHAMDGALKYAGYLMVFLIARYASSWEAGNRVLRNMLIACGVIVASAGYLTAAGLAKYPSAVRSGVLLGSFQYPNALAAFAMFLLFFLYYAWYEGLGNPALDLAAGILYSAAGFLLVGSVFLTESRATMLMFVTFMVFYGVSLPSGARLKIMSRAGVSVLSFAAVALKLDTALGKGDAGATRQGLAVGLALSASLEAVRWLLDRRISGLRAPSAEVAGAASAPAPSKTRPLTPFKSLLLRMSATALIIILAAAFLASTVKSPAVAKALSKVLPERVIAQLRSLKLTDVSVIIRFMATKDALSIALGYPFGTGAGGWDSLYHQYHRTPYWFSETHNHFAQMLVEVGFPGLLIYVVFWGILAYAAIRAYVSLSGGRTDAPAAEPARAGLSRSDAAAKIASSAAAVFALGVHSAMDFDLSLPAISVAMFVAIAILLSDTRAFVPCFAGLAARAGRKLPQPPPLKKTAKKSAVKAGFPWSLAATVLAAAILVPTVSLISGKLYKGMRFASTGSQIMKTSGDRTLARRYIVEAIARDPWNCAYSLELAKWAADDFAATGNPASRGMVPLYLKKAKISEPRNITRQTIECQLLLNAGFVDDAMRAAYELVLMMPTNRAYHESLADIGRTAISQHAAAVTAAGVSEEERRQHISDLSACAELLTSAFDILDAKRERVTGIYKSVFDPRGLEYTPKISLAFGQAAFLDGKCEASEKLLSAAAKDKALEQEANLWLGYLAEAKQKKGTAQAGFQSNREELRKVADLLGATKPTK